MPEIHPAPVQFSPEQLAADPILQFFHYAHLPAALQPSSRPFCILAELLARTLPRNAERSVALRKLLEAKDAAVRANVGRQMASGGSLLDRLKLERNDLREKLDKLNSYMERNSHDSLLKDQQQAMTEYLAILEARIENFEHERQPPMEWLEDGSVVREIGNHDPVRDGPSPFGD